MSIPKNSKIRELKLLQVRKHSQVWLQLLRETARRIVAVNPSKTPSTTDEAH
ncbi:hypothetical protein QUB05_33190 [Microcoleus sp. F10-C6]|uniref:hypothetical protein n=1 Tax=unclassified Microcoleus TaxID=2642155 RepID=UPI002FD061E8